MRSDGVSEVVAEMQVKPRDDWELQAAVMLIHGLLRVITSGNVPAEVHIDPSRLSQIKEMTLGDKLERIVQPGDPNERNVQLAAQWWDENRARLSFTPREGMMFPYVVSVAEQAEATVFSVVFQQLQAKGLERALMSLGLDLQTVMRSPKLLQDMVWFQFQLMLHEKLKSGSIITPGEMPTIFTG